MHSLLKMTSRGARSFRSLTVTLAVAFFALSFVTLSIASSLQIYFNFQTQKEIIASEQQLIAQDAAKEVKGFVQEKFTVLESAGNVGDLITANKEEQNLVLEKLLGLEPSFRQLFLLNTEGQELSTVSRLSGLISGPLTGLNMSELSSQMSQGETYISPVYIDEVTSEPMVNIAVPVTDVFGDFKGILMAEVNLKFMWDLVGRLKIGKNGLAYVVDKQGNLIAFGDISRVLKRENLIHLEEVNEFVKGDELTHVSGADVSNGIQGNQVVANHAHLGKPDWAVVVELPVEEAYETVTLGIGLSLLTMLISFFLAILAGTYLSKRITRPIINLRDAANEIGRGNLDAKIEIKTKNEIGELASAFNQMTQDLKKTQEQIKRHAQELEYEVRDRTKELDNKIKELEDTKTAILNMMEDIDKTNRELVETQEKLKKSLEELKEIDVKKDQFISIAAHELKTPLTSIHGFAQLLQNKDVAKNIIKRAKYLKIMDHETKRLAKLVDDILNLSRIDLGTLNVSLEGLEINNVMETVKREMDILIKEKGLESEWEVERDLPSIVTDGEKLTQILINIVNNAVKYTPKGKITVRVFKDEDNINFIIKDTGIGIAKKEQEKIFERFYQVDSSYTRKAGGTGLGLAICKEFINVLGGKIWVESETGRGSEFHFTLPLKGAPKMYIREEERRAEENIKKAEEVRKKTSEIGGLPSLKPSKRD